MDNVMLGISKILENEKTRSKKRGMEAKEQLAQAFGIARPKALGELNEKLLSDLEGRNFQWMRNLEIAGSGPAWLDFNATGFGAKCFGGNGETELTAQPSDEIGVIDRIRIYLPDDLADADYETLMNKALVRIKYDDNREVYDIPFRFVARTDKRRPNCGNNTTTPIEGTKVEIIDLGNEYKLEADEMIVIKPQDAKTRIGLAWLHGTAGSAPSVTSINLNVVALGRRFTNINRR